MDMQRGLQEEHFNYDAQQDPAARNTYTSVDILSESSYCFMTNAFHGLGGFRDGTYLIPHSREMFYLHRRKLAYYKNYVKPITRAMIDPVFSEPIVRQITDDNGTELENTLFGDFLADCDNCGKPFQTFMEDVLYKARLHGITFVVMDNFSAEEMPPSLSEARQARIFPYVYIRTADNVVSYELDKWGNIVSIMFKERPEKVVQSTDGKLSTEDRYRLWTADYVAVLKKNKNSDQYEEVSRTNYNLGMVPVIPVYSVNRVDYSTLLVDPPMFDIARLNHAIFNIDSEIRNLERAQSFSLLYCPGDTVGDLTISEHNVLWVPLSASFAPGFISPNPAILTGLVSDMKDMVDQLYKLAEQNGVIGVKEAKSGIAKQWDFIALEGVLKKTSAIAKMAERQIAMLFQTYTSESFELVSEYPWEFGPISVGDEVDTFDKIQAKATSKLFKAEIEKKMAKLMLNDMPREELNKILDDIDGAYAQKKEAATAAIGNLIGQGATGAPSEAPMGETGAQDENSMAA